MALCVRVACMHVCVETERVPKATPSGREQDWPIVFLGKRTKPKKKREREPGRVNKARPARGTETGSRGGAKASFKQSKGRPPSGGTRPKRRMQQTSELVVLGRLFDCSSAQQFDRLDRSSFVHFRVRPLVCSYGPFPPALAKPPSATDSDRNRRNPNHAPTRICARAPSWFDPGAHAASSISDPSVGRLIGRSVGRRQKRSFRLSIETLLGSKQASCLRSIISGGCKHGQV